MPRQTRIRHTEYGTTYRVIRTEARGSDLFWVTRDESYYVRDGRRGAVTRISVDAWATGAWEVYDPKILPVGNYGPTSFKGSMGDLAGYDHVHNSEGYCLKKRFGKRCHRVDQ